MKNFFKKGALPSEEQFGDLIDSSLNMVDEGFSRTAANGVEVSTHGENDTLLTFFKGNDPELPKWSVGFEQEGEKLLFSSRSAEPPTPSLTLAPGGKAGINNCNPAWELDVQGVVRAEGRTGTNPTGERSVAADGKWHNITQALTGCHAFEVMAGVGKKKTGRYALLHAFALNTFNPHGFFFNFLNLKKRIRSHHAFYNSRSDMLRLRWYGENGKYYLQLRTNTDYGEGIHIRFSVTKLWFDEDMSECWQD